LLWTLGVVAEIVVFLLMPRIALRVSMRPSCWRASPRGAALPGDRLGVEFIVLLFVAQLLHGASFGAHHAATMAALNRWFAAGQQARAQALYGSVAYGAGGLGGALLAGALWESAGAAITFSAASGAGADRPDSGLARRSGGIGAGACAIIAGPFRITP
jgi:PPP family 3-phenylpropionic acid transporter